MKEVKFKRIKAEFIGFGGIKGNKYEFKGIEESVQKAIKKGWTYIGYVPICTRGDGGEETISLMFEREITE